MTAILQFSDVVVSFSARSGLMARLAGASNLFNAVDHVDLDIRKGEIVGIVGESGSGKTTICKAALGLVDLAGGSISVDGKPASLARGELQMVFQDPLSSLNPRQTVNQALATPLRLHGRTSSGDLAATVERLLRDVGLGPQFGNRYPHELSGGQLQRAAIARALATNPRVLFADEAVSKLDVSVRAQILNLLKRLRDTYDLTIVFVTHDLHVARFLCDRIAIMYFGKLVELGATRDVYSDPRHPYSQELLGTLKQDSETVLSTRDTYDPARDDRAACRYLNRCPHVMDRCRQRHPSFFQTGPGHVTACYLCDEQYTGQAT